MQCSSAPNRDAMHRAKGSRHILEQLFVLAMHTSQGDGAAQLADILTMASAPIAAGRCAATGHAHTWPLSVLSSVGLNVIHGRVGVRVRGQGRVATAVHLLVGLRTPRPGSPGPAGC